MATLFYAAMNQEFLEIKTELVQLLSSEQAWKYRIIPKESSVTSIIFFSDLQPDNNLLEELEMLFGKFISIEVVDSDFFQKSLGKYYRKEESSSKLSFSGNSEDFVYQLILEAKNFKSSDIHIEVYEDVCRVRVRIDGMLTERCFLEKKDYPSLVNKIKIMSNLDIAEKRLPQDGRIFFNYKKNRFDIRVSVLPTLHGEKIVMRLLSNDATNIDINKLGFSPKDLNNYLEGAKRPHGLLLISGPTGSGKTTTLYATLKLLNEVKRNIVTIEDPIEYTLEGINQVQLKEALGLTFGSALRTFLRQDPDVIMVGEIRDADTATMAIRASLTGHLVLSTIHTNSAWGTVSRLVDMGIPSFLVASTLNTSVAQRLVKILCNNCKSKAEFSDDLYPASFKPPKNIAFHYRPIGCSECHYTGYKGRKAVYEVITVDFVLSERIKSGTFSISDYLKEKGIKTLGENAFELFEEGLTTVEEIYPLLINY
ncbi:GspE/PulE family protein [Cytophagaceae bacterium ABcell3]|nr:GspE/PulE family protein [Cytophagaceae bacterium ABcell3]